MIYIIFLIRSSSMDIGLCSQKDLKQELSLLQFQLSCVILASIARITRWRQVILQLWHLINRDTGHSKALIVHEKYKKSRIECSKLCSYSCNVPQDYFTCAWQSYFGFIHLLILFYFLGFSRRCWYYTKITYRMLSTYWLL